MGDSVVDRICLSKGGTHWHWHSSECDTNLLYPTVPSLNILPGNILRPRICVHQTVIIAV